MPGLVGIVSKCEEKRVEPSLFDKMSSSIRHRDWYKTDNYADKDQGVAISRVHLSIINPDCGPYPGRDGKVKVFLHGEIYNDDADDNNQLDYIYRAYDRFGLDLAKHLNGSFVIIVVDEAKDAVFIVNDRTASKPLFYFVDGQVVYFAPELKALLLVPSLKKKLNLSAVASFLSCGYFLNGQTLIEDVHLLDNATVLSISKDGISAHKYWNYVFDEGAKDLGFKYYQNTLAELIRKAVKRRIRTNHKYGVLLSGGYDSRGILGCYLEEKKGERVHTISWGSEENIPHSDCAVARGLAEKVGTHHTFYKLRPEEFIHSVRDFIYLSDGMTDACGNYPESLKIFQQIREELGVQIILRGDECLGWIPVFDKDETGMFQTLGIKSLVDQGLYRSLLPNGYYKVLEKLSVQLLDDISSRYGSSEIHNRKDFFYLDQRLKHYLNPLNYVKTIEVEARTPYIDNDIIDFVETLPVKYRLDKYLYRRTVPRMFPALFDEVASQSDGIDWDSEFDRADEFRDFFRKELQDPSSVLKSINPAVIGGLLGKNAGYLSKKILKTIAVQLVGRFPTLYAAGKRKYKTARKKTEGSEAHVHGKKVAFCLLTLKIWGDLFLTENRGIGCGKKILQRRYLPRNYTQAN